MRAGLIIIGALMAAVVVAAALFLTCLVLIDEVADELERALDEPRDVVITVGGEGGLPFRGTIEDRRGMREVSGRVPAEYQLETDGVFGR